MDADQAIKAQLELLGDLPPELANKFRELAQDLDQIAAAYSRAKQRGDLAALRALLAQGQAVEQKLSELGQQFEAVIRATRAANA